MLEVEDLIVAYPGREGVALDRVSLLATSGRTLAIVGPSGAGKSTLLRAIAGLLQVRSGDVRVDGRSIRAQRPQARRIAMVFHDDALFPAMSVRANLHFALRSRAGAAARVSAAAGAMRMAGYLDRRPRDLSGGERQRVSIARALLSDPAVLLLDEPLAHLDPSLRLAVREEVLGVRSRFAGPILYVTHDHAEAMAVGDELAVLIDGRIEDVGESQRVYDAPRCLAVARFLGERAMNLFPANGAIVGIRPEHVRLVTGGETLGRITRRESTGADAYVHVAVDGREILARVPASHRGSPGELVTLEFPPEHLRRFDATSGVAIA
jgi:ABC-type sugar transport system ATPase subunit